ALGERFGRGRDRSQHAPMVVTGVIAGSLTKFSPSRSARGARGDGDPRDVAELRPLVDELLDEPRACDSVHARVFASDPVHRSSYLYPRPESVARARRYA